MIQKDETEKNLPTGAIKTKLKFQKSEKTGAYIGFISQNPKTGRYCGVRQDSPYPKKVCVVDAKLSYTILQNVLYDVVCIPMKEKNGYVCISATPVQFAATVDVVYVPKAVYVVEVKFGNKVITFDPLDGKGRNHRTIAGVREILEKRVDIKDLAQVVENFNDAANEMVRNFRHDGFLSAT